MRKRPGREALALYTLISFPAVSLLYDFISEPVKISMVM